MTMHKLCTFAVASLAMITGITNSALATDDAAVTTPTAPKESGFYLGANLGQSKYDTDNFGNIHTLTTEIDDTDTAWSLTVGYRFTTYIGLEVSYLDTGKALGTGSRHLSYGVPISYMDDTLEFGAAVTGPALALVATIPTGNFEFNGRIGALFANTEETFVHRGTTSVPPEPPRSYDFSFGASASSTELIYGLGAGYNFGNHFQFRLDWMKAANVDDASQRGGGDIDLLTAGFQYRF